MCYLVLFWVSRSRKMATILTASRKKFISVGPYFKKVSVFFNRLF